MIHNEPLTNKSKCQKRNTLKPYHQASSFIDIQHCGRYDLMWARLEPWERKEDGE